MYKKNYLVFLLIILYSNILAGKGNVLTGIDVLKNNFSILKGKNVGLITNHTGVDRFGKSTIDILFEQKSFKLIRLFSPEHGLRGIYDSQVSDQIDEKTGLEIVSLYGKKRKPDKNDLKNIDVLVFDIQDIGCRFYTYIATMAYAMQAAAENNIEFIVLDRPNPIGGKIVDGFVPDTDSITYLFTSIYPIPTRHGMTIGELAKLFNEYFKINCKLTVIKMKNWKRKYLFRDTGLPWINPSPNMKSLEGALAYPYIGWLESTQLSMGRGTQFPFEYFGAPYINKDSLFNIVKNFQIKGARVIPYSFIPARKNHKFFNQKCNGLRIIIYQPDKFDAFEFGLKVFKTLHELYPEKFSWSKSFKINLGNSKFEYEFEKNLKTFVKLKEKQIKKFKKIRKNYLLY